MLGLTPPVQVEDPQSDPAACFDFRVGPPYSRDALRNREAALEITAKRVMWILGVYRRSSVPFEIGASNENEGAFCRGEITRIGPEPRTLTVLLIVGFGENRWERVSLNEAISLSAAQETAFNEFNRSGWYSLPIASWSNVLFCRLDGAP